MLQHYQARFGAMLVDEFQDTNAIQYAWLRLLAGKRDNCSSSATMTSHLRLARRRVQNILDFEQDFPQTRLFRLEQNYRSTGNILQAANAVIANNPSRLGKKLWTEDGQGEPIRLYAAFNEIDEARFVVDTPAGRYRATASDATRARFYTARRRNRVSSKRP